MEISKVGFWGNPHKEKCLRALIDDILLYSKIPQLVDKKEQIVTDFMKLAKNRKEAITRLICTNKDLTYSLTQTNRKTLSIYVEPEGTHNRQSTIDH